MILINSLNEFVGKDDLKQNLQIYLNSSKQSNEPLEHCLFYGLPGTGKTTLAKIIAHELETKIRIVQGSSLQKPIDVINLLLSINEKDIVFIDEIHAVNKICFELFYSAMEEHKLDINIGKDFNTKITRIDLPKFTLIAATTSLGKIPQPLEDRFGIIFNLNEYSDEEIKSITHLYADKFNLDLSNVDIESIAKASKGIPRICVRIIKRLNDFIKTKTNLSVNEILKRLGYIYNEYDIFDKKYLLSLKNQHQPIGSKTISQMINIDPLTIELKIEPYLLTQKLIIKTCQGRIITIKGLQILKCLENS